jgi:hypothetical protein
LAISTAASTTTIIASLRTASRTVAIHSCSTAGVVVAAAIHVWTAVRLRAIHATTDTATDSLAISILTNLVLDVDFLPALVVENRIEDRL